MSELMAVGQALTMSSIDLLDLVNQSRASHGEAKIENRHFLARIEDELDGELPPRKNFTHPSNGLAIGYYDLTIDQCRLVGMRESKGVRRWVLDKLKAMGVPQTYAQALLEAGRLAQLAEEQAQQLALAAPKVEFVDKYVQATGIFTFREVAKLLKANEARFREFLIDSKVMYYLGKKLTAYKSHEDAGRFAVKTDTAKNGHDYRQTFFTPKGVHWVAGQWAKHQEREVASASGN